MSETHRPRRIPRRIGAVLAGLLAIIVALYMVLYVAMQMALIRTDRDAKQRSVTSKDGTIIAHEQTGAGPAIILVAGALADRTGSRRLARPLAQHFTVINYGRGRGKSGDTQPYAAEREVEDIEALIGANGGPAFVFGISSGAALALEGASKLDGKVKRLFLYEPPFIVDNSRPPMPDDLINRSTNSWRQAAGTRRSSCSLQKPWAFQTLP
jgi:pimeloyl-ACP methyl ester carboxylesterase